MTLKVLLLVSLNDIEDEEVNDKVHELLSQTKELTPEQEVAIINKEYEKIV